MTISNVYDYTTIGAIKKQYYKLSKDERSLFSNRMAVTEEFSSYAD